MLRAAVKIRLGDVVVVRSARFERALASASRWCLCRWATSARRGRSRLEPWSGIEPLTS